MILWRGQQRGSNFCAWADVVARVQYSQPNPIALVQSPCKEANSCSFSEARRVASARACPIQHEIATAVIGPPTDVIDVNPQLLHHNANGA